MNKKTFFIFLTALFISFLTGCDNSWLRYTSSENNFSILLPQEWKKSEGLYNTALIAKAPLTNPNERFQKNISVVVTQLPQKIDLTTYFEANKDALTKGLASIADISEGNISAGRLEGKWISFEGKMQELTLKIISAAWMKDNRVYVISCASEAKEFSKYAPVFNRIMRSLRVK